jgi:VanZ family protein
MSLCPFLWPVRLRAGLYAAAVGVLLYLCLAPARDLPGEPLWDKAEHAIAWAVLSGLGLLFWPARPGRIGGFAVAFGAMVEVLQATLPLGRDGDLRDLLADSVGVAAALIVWVLATWAAGLPRRGRPADAAQT